MFGNRYSYFHSPAASTHELDDFVRDPHPFSSIVADRDYTFLALHDVEPTYIVGHAAASR